MGVIEEEIANLKKQQDLVLRQLLAYRQEARTEIDPGKKVLLEDKAKQCEKEYDDLSKEIERLEHGEPPELTPEVLSRFKAEFHKEWEADLHWLDYDRPEISLQKLVRVKQQEAVLLFIQRWIRMKADLYIKRIRKRVFDDGTLRPFIEDFSNEGRVDPQRFIERWRASLQIEGSEASVQSVIQKLRGAVKHGQTLYLEIRVAQVSNDFCGWLLEQFWRPLIEAEGISAVVILMAEESMPKGQMQGEWCRQIAHFERYKYCEIKLVNWQQPEIERWMEQYLNAALHKRYLTPQNASIRAKQVYTQSDKGVPLHAHNYILGHLLTEVVEQLSGQSHATS